MRHKAHVQIGRMPIPNMRKLASKKNQEITITEGGKEMLSRDCDGCSQMKVCGRRYFIVEKGSCVYCPDGTAHLIDGL